MIAGISIAIVLSALIIVAGIVHLTTAFAAASIGAIVWRTLVGLVYVIGGIWLFMHPVLGLVSFTFVLSIIFLIEGIFAIISFFQVRKTDGSSWLLFDGIITLILAFLILDRWPTSAAWAIATIVGVNLLISGFTRLMALLAIRRIASSTA
jgi:uncharacterized membrane protein HdeD (DUF308 family)